MDNQNLSTSAAVLVGQSLALGDRPKTLKTNPFTTYRDPETGRWIVVKPAG